MRSYIGNCVNSFDSDCECVFSELPWSNVSDLAFDIGDSQATHIDQEQFLAETDFNDTDIEVDDIIEWMIAGSGVYVAHDGDIHYFFV